MSAAAAADDDTVIFADDTPFSLSHIASHAVLTASAHSPPTLAVHLDPSTAITTAVTTAAASAACVETCTPFGCERTTRLDVIPVNVNCTMNPRLLLSM